MPSSTFIIDPDSSHAHESGRETSHHILRVCDDNLNRARSTQCCAAYPARGGPHSMNGDADMEIGKLEADEVLYEINDLFSSVWKPKGVRTFFSTNNKIDWALARKCEHIL